MAQAQHGAATTDTAQPFSSPKSAQQWRQEALQSFEEALSRDPDHPSLLRRRAMVLEAQGDPSAYPAYRAAQRELRFRAAYPALFSPLPAKWLAEVEARLTALKPPQPVDTTQEAVENHLAAGNYSDAHRLLQSVPADSAWAQPLRTWFERHLVVDKNTHLVMPKARENFLRLLGLYAIPTPYELMALNGATYRAKHNQPLGLPAGWEVIGWSNQLLPGKQYGYLAMAYRHTTTHQIVISHGGTDWTDDETWKAEGRVEEPAVAVNASAYHFTASSHL
jgi:hypothetical protein